jgi:hypothetical protein
MSAGKIFVNDLISLRYDFDDAPSAYNQLVTNTGALGILLDYKESNKTGSPTSIALSSHTQGPALIGAGNFALRTLLPALQKANSAPLASSYFKTGLSSLTVGSRLWNCHRHH